MSLGQAADLFFLRCAFLFETSFFFRFSLQALPFLIQAGRELGLLLLQPGLFFRLRLQPLAFLIYFFSSSAAEERWESVRVWSSERAVRTEPVDVPLGDGVKSPAA